MKDQARRAELSFGIFNNCLCMKIKLDDAIHYNEIKVHTDIPDFGQYIFWWIHSNLKHLYFEMPIEKIQLNHSQGAVDYCGNALSTCIKALEGTNNAVNRYRNFKGAAKDHDGILVFNVDDSNAYEKLHLEIRKKQDNLYYENMNSGWNSMTRQWEHAPVPFQVDDFVKYIFDGRIKKIILINNYLLEKYLFQENVYLLALMTYLGVELINIEQDHSELTWYGYLQKSAFYNKENTRFATGLYPEYWDAFYGNRETTNYISALVFDVEEARDIRLNNDYKLILISNSRLNESKMFYPAFLYLMDRIDSDNIFHDFQLWFLSLRYLILHIMPMDHVKRLRANASLHNIYYNVTQMFKYETVYGLETQRPIEIYGDEGWGVVLPQHYQNKFLNHEEQMSRLLSGDYLQIIPNCNISWLFTAWPIYECLKANIPFICAASISKPGGREELGQLEYSNVRELNELVELAPGIYKGGDLKPALDYMKGLLVTNKDNVVDGICHGRLEEFNAYYDAVDMMNTDLESKVKQYLDTNETFVRESFNLLILGHKTEFDMQASRYYQRPYIQNILKANQKEQ